MADEIEDFEIETDKGDREVVEEYENDENTKKFLLDVLNGGLDLRRLGFESSSNFLDGVMKSRVKYYLSQNPEITEKSPEMYMYRHMGRKGLSKKYHAQLPETSATRIVLTDSVKLLLRCVNKIQTDALNVVSEYINDNYKETIGNYCHIRGLCDIYETFQSNFKHVVGDEMSLLLTRAVEERLNSTINKKISDNVFHETIHSDMKKKINVRFEKDIFKGLNDTKRYIDNNRSECVSIGIISFVANSQVANGFFSEINIADKTVAEECLKQIKEYCEQESQKIKETVRTSIHTNFSSSKSPEPFKETIKIYREKLAGDGFFEGVVPDEGKEERLKQLNEIAKGIQKQSDEMNKQKQEMDKQMREVLQQIEELKAKS